ncbi:hypothetical protein SNEBB_005324 [Seison nebaliae]|nr:hypothetical protein SNEBB_005324 [Seison nebaliae]
MAKKVYKVNLNENNGSRGTQWYNEQTILDVLENGGNEPNIESSKQSIGGESSEGDEVVYNARTVEIPIESPSPSPTRPQVEDELTPIDRSNGNNMEQSNGMERRYSAYSIIQIYIPVSICMIGVVIIMKLKGDESMMNNARLPYIVYDENDNESSGARTWKAIVNALIFIAVVVVMTIFLVLMYKFRCMKFITIWLFLSTLLLVSWFTYTLVCDLCSVGNSTIIDMFTVVFLLYNFAVVGMLSIHWKGPLIVRQFYLVFVSALIASVFIQFLPEWTGWVLLAFIAIWDLIAVLCPHGPLRILVETAQERGDELFPAIIYSSTLIYSILSTKTHDTLCDNDDNDNDIQNQTTTTNNFVLSSTENNNNNNNYRTINQSSDDTRQNNITPSIIRQQQQQEREDDNETSGVKLGLGDFVFYSLLVGKASVSNDWNTTILCFVAILIGLSFTLIILSMVGKALPALPISILFGMIFYFATRFSISPYMEDFTKSLVVI